jgi:hypothetical protein
VTLALVMLCGAVALSEPAEAAPHSRKEAAERYQKGVALYKEGDYATGRGRGR